MAAVLDIVIVAVQLLTFVCAVSLAAVVVMLYRIHTLYDHLPGPTRESFFTGNLPGLKKKRVAGACFNIVMFEWCLEHGDTFVIFFMQRAIVVTINTEAVKEILTGYYEKPTEFYVNSLGFLLGSRFAGYGLVTDCKYSSWAPRRAAMNPAFNHQMLKPLMVDFNRTVDDLMEKLTQFVDKKQYIRLLDELNRTTLDVIGKVAFQVELNSLHDDDSPFPSAFNKVMEGFAISRKNPIARIFPWLLKQSRQEVKESCLILRDFARKVMRDRRAAMDHGEYVPQDILTYLMKTFNDEDEEAVELAVDDFITIFLAGQETTANTVSFALLELGRNSEVREKVREEVDSIIGERSEINYEDLARMTYLGDVIKESLRLCPPVGVTTRDVDKALTIDGLHIPKNSWIMVSTFISSRHPNLHPDPERFWPERWQDDTIRPSTYVSYPFMMGPRSCIGQTFAKMEAKVLIAKFLQRFSYELDPDQSFAIDEKLTMKPKDGVRARLSARI